MTPERMLELRQLVAPQAHREKVHDWMVRRSTLTVDGRKIVSELLDEIEGLTNMLALADANAAARAEVNSELRAEIARLTDLVAEQKRTITALLPPGDPSTVWAVRLS